MSARVKGGELEWAEHESKDRLGHRALDFLCNKSSAKNASFFIPEPPALCDVLRSFITLLWHNKCELVTQGMREK